MSEHQDDLEQLIQRAVDAAVEHLRPHAAGGAVAWRIDCHRGETPEDYSGVGLRVTIEAHTVEPGETPPHDRYRGNAGGGVVRVATGDEGEGR